MPLYQREGSPFWQYSFSVKGVRFRGSTGRESKREARIVEDDEKRKAREQRSTKDEWRLRDCLGAYWKERAEKKRSADTIFAKLAALYRHLGENTPIMALTNAMLMDYRAARRGEGLLPHTVNRDLAHLKAALNHANQMHGKQIPALAWSRIRVAEPPHRIRFLSRDEYARLIDAAHPAIRPIIQFAVATGLRKDNILSLDWSQVDLSSMRLTVRLKGDKLHQVRLTAAARAALASMGERRGPVFDTLNFRRRWAAAVKGAGLDDLRFHDLRHTFASWARMAGSDLADICEALGHSNISVTMRYAHIAPDHHVTAFDRISDSVWSQKETQSIRRKAK